MSNIVQFAFGCQSQDAFYILLFVCLFCLTMELPELFSHNQPGYILNLYLTEICSGTEGKMLLEYLSAVRFLHPHARFFFLYVPDQSNQFQKKGLIRGCLNGHENVFLPNLNFLSANVASMLKGQHKQGGG